MEEDFKQRLKRKETWQRSLYMLFFIVIYSFSKLLIILVMLFQMMTILLAGKANEPLLKFGQNISTYLYQIVIFLTFNSERRPFPFSAWPNGEPGKTDPYLEE